MVQPIQGRQPFPSDLRRELSNPLVPWEISERIFTEMRSQGTEASFKKIQVLPTDPEWRFVWRFFMQNKPLKYGIRHIFCVHQRHLTKVFESTLALSEQKEENSGADWRKMDRANQRSAVMDRLKEFTALFSSFAIKEADGRTKTCTKTKVLPLWHGTSKEVCDKVAKSGFEYFGKRTIGSQKSGDPKNTDVGFFGSGIYFTDSARYAADIYSTGHVVLAWVSMSKPFPVVGDPKQRDMEILKGEAHHLDYDAHFVPVVPKDKDPYCAIYLPCKGGQEPVCDEIVVFQRPQVLPRFFVELEVEVPYLMEPTVIPQSASDLVRHILKMLENPEVDADEKLRGILCLELAALLKLKKTDYLAQKQKTFFQNLTAVLNQAGKINRAVVLSMEKGKKFVAPSKPEPAPNFSSNQSSPSTSNGKHPATYEDVEPIKKKPKLGPSNDDEGSSSKDVGVSKINIISLRPKVPVPDMAFGKKMWETYFGEVGDEPPLPSNIMQILNAPCPFWPNKKVEETHMLTLIPAAVNGVPLTLNTLSKLIKSPKQGHATRCYSLNTRDYNKDEGLPLSQWALMGRNVIDESRDKSYPEQLLVLKSYIRKGKKPYGPPPLLGAAVSILMEYVRSGNRLFSENPWTFTRCQENWNKNYQTGVGGFVSMGLDISYHHDHERVGLAPFRVL